jgi:hypothetical protein
MSRGEITTYKPGPLKPFRDAASLKVEVSFASNYNNPTPTYVDLTGRIRFTQGTGLSWNRGRNDEWGEVVPGQFQITFNNFDRYLDPSFSGSPYWPNVDWGRPMRITAYYLGQTYIQFVGLVDEWECGWTAGGDAICTARGFEILGALSLNKIVASTFLTITTPTRLAELCSSAGISATVQDFIAGTLALKPQSYATSDALSACQQVVTGQNQIFFTSRDGFFRNRARYTAFDTNLGVFGENAGEIHAARMMAPSIGSPYQYTIVKVTSQDSTDGTVGQTATKNVPLNPGQPGGGGSARFGSRTLDLAISAVPTGGALTVATSISNSLQTKQGPRIKSATIFPMRDPTNAWPVVLDADQGNSCTFKYTAPGGGPRFSQLSTIRSIAHQVTADNWVATWNLSP